MIENNEDLLRRIRLGEDSVLELKRVEFAGDRVSGPRRDSMADELAAMANTASGTVLLGVDDSTREIAGIPPDRLDLVEEWLRSICNDQIDPPLDCVIRRLTVPDSSGAERAVLWSTSRSLSVHRSRTATSGA